MCSFLQEQFGLEHDENLEWEAMLDRYSRARIVPNEAILAEVIYSYLTSKICLTQAQDFPFLQD